MSKKKDQAPPPPPPIRTVITGFGPFPGQPINPAAALALSFDEAHVGGGRVRGCQIPCSWGRAFSGITQGLEGAQPKALIMLGVSDRPTAQVELLAHNRRGGALDVDGQSLPEGLLLPGGADVLKTTLPITGLPASALSEDAGDYLCNAVFYWSMAFFGHIPYRGFVHIPHGPPEQGRALIEQLLSTIEQLETSA